MRSLIKRPLPALAIALSLAIAASCTLGASRVLAGKRSYGLGLPRTAGTGGATRDAKLPLMTAIAPLDGGRVLAARPTFYWYLAPEASAAPTQVTFILRNPQGERAFQATGEIATRGLYKFALPATAPALVPGQNYRWDLRVKFEDGGDRQAVLNGSVRLEPNDGLAKQAQAAKTPLERAKLYDAAGYWYDAIHAYSAALTANPEDAAARSGVKEMLTSVFDETYDLPLACDTSAAACPNKADLVAGIVQQVYEAFTATGASGRAREFAANPK